MTTILAGAGRPPSVLVPDATGEEQVYSFARAPDGLDSWAVVLTRLDTGARYRVAVDENGRWRCSCPSEKYRKRGAPPCKHIGSARELRMVGRALTLERALCGV